MKRSAARRLLSDMELDDLVLYKGMSGEELIRRMEARRCAIHRLMECGKLDYLDAYGVVNRVGRQNRVIQNRSKDMATLVLRKCTLCGRPIWRAKVSPKVFCRIHHREMLLEKHRKIDRKIRLAGYLNRSSGLRLRKKELYRLEKIEVELLEKIVTLEKLVQIIQARGADLDRYAAMIDELTNALAEKLTSSRLDPRMVLLEYIDAMEIKVWKQESMW
jgi:hypothetical protein